VSQKPEAPVSTMTFEFLPLLYCKYDCAYLQVREIPKRLIAQKGVCDKVVGKETGTFSRMERLQHIEVLESQSEHSEKEN
jgi:hypothetical protein